MSNVNFNGQCLIGKDRRAQNESFSLTLTYSDLIKSDDIIVFNNQKFYLLNEFVFVAFKNAHHDQLGYVYTNFQPQKLKSGAHVSSLGEEILEYFGV